MEIKYNTVIVGAGLGGMTSAALLSGIKDKVLLIEQHYMPGGAASNFKRNNYLFEVGLHEIDYNPNGFKEKIFSRLKVQNNIEFLSIDEFYKIQIEKEGSTLEFIMPNNFDVAIEKLCSSYPEDEIGIKKMFKYFKEIEKETKFNPFITKVKTIIYPFLKFLTPYSYKAKNITVGNWMDLNITNKDVKFILMGSLVYYHSDPYELSFYYFCLGQAGYFHGSSYIKGSSQELSNYLTRYVEKNGGNVLFGKKVTEILVKKGKVCGVVIEDSYNQKSVKHTIYCDNIIFNSAPKNLLNLLDEENKSKIEKKYESLKIAPSVCSLYLGLNIDVNQYFDIPYSTFLFSKYSYQNGLSELKNYNETINDMTKRNYAILNYSQLDSSLCSKDNSVITVSFLENMDKWINLNEEDYKKRKKEITDDIINRLESIYKGISNYIVIKELSTPKTLERYTMNPEGSPYGFIPNIEKFGKNQPTVDMPIKNLYHVGAFSNPGHGFTPTIISGFFAYLLVSKFEIKRHIKRKYFKYGYSRNYVDERMVSIIDKKIIANDTLEITFNKPKQFQFIPGQYVYLKLKNQILKDYDNDTREFSIVSHPSENKLVISMRISESGYKTKLNELNIGEKCLVMGSLGEFTIRNSSNNICFIASGIGITPILPMLKELEIKNYKNPVTIIYSNKSEENTAYLKEIRQITKRLDIKMHLKFTENSPRIDKEYLTQCILETNNTDFYIVGKNYFIENMKKLLFQLNVSNDKIYTDSFNK